MNRFSLTYLTLLLLVVPQGANAQAFCGFEFLGPPVCRGEDCNVSINLRPTGVARILEDGGDGPAIVFAPNSIFDLGEQGRMNFGNAGGVQATFGSAGIIPSCVNKSPGLEFYTVNVTTGGWFELTAGNRMEFGENNIVNLAEGSGVEGRLILETEGTVGIASKSGDVAMGNVDITAGEGITVSAEGGVTLGELGGGPDGITITAQGPVNVASAGSDGPVSVTAAGDITVGDISRAQTIDLLITSADGGAITVGDNTVSAETGPFGVSCTAQDDCDDYDVTAGGGTGTGTGGGDGGSSDDSCNSQDRDPDVPNACVAGGAISPGWLLLALFVFWRRLSVLNIKKRAPKGAPL